MKSTFLSLVLATLGVAAAKADTVNILLDHPNLSTSGGGSLIVTGTLINTTGATVFLNGDYFNVTGSGFSIQSQFFNNAPISLAPGASSGNIELFDVNVPPGPLPAGQELGNYGLLGGPDASASNNLGSAGFDITNATSATSAPEIDPSLATSGLVLIVGGLAVLRGRRFNRIANHPTPGETIA